jgi:hypothetical protein
MLANDYASSSRLRGCCVLVGALQMSLTTSVKASPVYALSFFGIPVPLAFCWAISSAMPASVSAKTKRLD